MNVNEEKLSDYEKNITRHIYELYGKLFRQQLKELTVNTIIKNNISDISYADKDYNNSNNAQYKKS